MIGSETDEVGSEPTVSEIVGFSNIVPLRCLLKMMRAQGLVSHCQQEGERAVYPILLLDVVLCHAIAECIAGNFEQATGF